MAFDLAETPSPPAPLPGHHVPMVVGEGNDGPLRVLTVGRSASARAHPTSWGPRGELRGKAVFRMVGPSLLSSAGERQLQEAVELVGPVPRSTVAQHYAWADVFLLPSVCEGSATATYEAIASGIPVLCTPHAGSVIEDGRQGFVIPFATKRPSWNAWPNSTKIDRSWPAWASRHRPWPVSSRSSGMQIVCCKPCIPGRKTNSIGCWHSLNR